MPWSVTVRSGPKVERMRFDGLAAALDALEARAAALVDAATVAPRSVDTKVKRFEPAQQVAARIELSGPERLIPRTIAGIDVRGDGSSEAYTGRVRRQLVERRRNETSVAALRRAVTPR